MLPRRSRWIALAACALLAGCSATKFVYNNLDWFAAWELGKYLSLNAGQKSAFEKDFRGLWRWHRNSQLALYVRDLRELADAARQPLTPEQVADFRARTTGHFARLWEQLQPEAARLLQDLDDGQVAGLLDGMADWRREQAEEEAGLDGVERQQRAAEWMGDSLKRWLGRLAPAQLARIEQWAAARQEDAGLELAYREAWAEAFAVTLASRREPGFAGRVRALFMEPDVTHRAAIVAQRDANRALFVSLMSDLSHTLDDFQREHFRVELRELADDLEALSAQR